MLNALAQPLAPYRLVIGGLPALAGTEEQYGSQLPIKFADSLEAFDRWARALQPAMASGVPA